MIGFNNHNLIRAVYSCNHYICTKCNICFYEHFQDPKFWSAVYFPPGQTAGGFLCKELDDLMCEEIIIKKIIE